jgi:hypothetical protein
MRKALAAVLLCLLAGCVTPPTSTAPDGAAPIDGPPPAEPWRPVWASAMEAQIRPGSAAPGCTFDWVFVDPVEGAYFIGIAAHCTDNPDADDRVDGTGTRTGNAGGKEWGTVVFDSDNQTLHDMGVEERVDFALIRLDEGANLQANPQALGYDAPVGFIDCSETSPGDVIGWHGYGMVFGEADATRKREGALATCDGSDYGAYTAAIFGDSGSAVTHVASGKALGIVSRLGAGTTPPTELTGATLPYILRELAKSPDFANVKLATIDGGYVGLEG